MALTDSYATVGEYRAATPDKNDSKDDLIIERHLLTVSRYLDYISKSFFGRDSTAVTRRFTGNGRRELDLRYEGDCPGIASTTGLIVSVSGTVYTINTDFELRPLNAALLPEPRPWTSLYIPTTSSRGIWSSAQTVSITGIFGWPKVPEIVWATCIELCGIWRGESPRATGRMNELESVVTTSPMAMSLLKRFQEWLAPEISF